MENKKAKKTIHIQIKNEELFNKLKGKIYAKGQTIVAWFEQKAKEEVENE